MVQNAGSGTERRSSLVVAATLRLCLSCQRVRIQARCRRRRPALKAWFWVRLMDERMLDLGHRRSSPNLGINVRFVPFRRSGRRHDRQYWLNSRHEIRCNLVI